MTIHVEASDRKKVFIFLISKSFSKLGYDLATVDLRSKGASRKRSEQEDKSGSKGYQFQSPTKLLTIAILILVR